MFFLKYVGIVRVKVVSCYTASSDWKLHGIVKIRLVSNIAYQIHDIFHI